MMQLGTRWTSGDAPPAAVPESIRAAIAGVDAEVSGESGTGRPRWTLTWLERRPIAELDTGVVVGLGPDGAAVITLDEEP